MARKETDRRRPPMYDCCHVAAVMSFGANGPETFGPMSYLLPVIGGHTASHHQGATRLFGRSVFTIRALFVTTHVFIYPEKVRSVVLRRQGGGRGHSGPQWSSATTHQPLTEQKIQEIAEYDCMETCEKSSETPGWSRKSKI